MRGFAMILVIYWHVVWFLFNSNPNAIDTFFLSFRMPLFFFISGLLAYSLKYDKQLYVKRVKNRIYGQLIPTFVVGILYTFAANVTISDFMFGQLKAGYWFTYCMFQIFLIYATFNYFLDRRNFSKGHKAIIHLGVMTLLYIVVLILKEKTDIFESMVSKVLSIKLILKYYFFFLVGVICRAYFEKFCKLLENNIIFPLIFILDIAIFITFGLTPISSPILGLGGIVIVYKFFYFYREHFSKTTKTGTMLSYIGRHTLEIYLLHYFVLLGFNHIECNLVSMCSKNWGLELIVGLTLSIVILCFCLVIMNILKTAPLLNRILFGIKKA